MRIRPPTIWIPVAMCAAQAAWPDEPPQSRLQLLGHYDFSAGEQFGDWIAEGPAHYYIDGGRLHLESVYRRAVDTRLTPEEIRASNGTDERMYRHVLVPLLRSAHPQSLAGYREGDPIRYGHTVLWNAHPLPDDYVIEYTFRNESPYPLHLLHFSALGLGGESIFSDALQPRTGVASEYMYGDMRTYRLSYFSGTRGTINMRKAPGRVLVNETADTSVHRAGQDQRARLVKEGGAIRFYLNGEEAFDFNDDAPFGGGYWGFRLMLMAAASYDDIMVYALLDEPVE